MKDEDIQMWCHRVEPGWGYKVRMCVSLHFSGVSNVLLSSVAVYTFHLIISHTLSPSPLSNALVKPGVSFDVDGAAGRRIRTHIRRMDIPSNIRGCFPGRRMPFEVRREVHDVGYMRSRRLGSM